MSREIDHFIPEKNIQETKILKKKILAAESFSGIESYRFTRSGTKIPVRISCATINDQNGVPTRGILNYRDITNRKLIEKELRKAKEDAEAANKCKSEFLAHIRH